MRVIIGREKNCAWNDKVKKRDSQGKKSYKKYKK